MYGRSLSKTHRLRHESCQSPAVDWYCEWVPGFRHRVSTLVLPSLFRYSTKSVRPDFCNCYNYKLQKSECSQHIEMILTWYVSPFNSRLHLLWQLCVAVRALSALLQPPAGPQLQLLQVLLAPAFPGSFKATKKCSWVSYSAEVCTWEPAVL